jgi:hypothetical protein
MKTTRRGFMKGMLGGAASLAVGGSLLDHLALLENL